MLGRREIDGMAGDYLKHTLLHVLHALRYAPHKPNQARPNTDIETDMRLR